MGRAVIVNADDFGQSVGINRGVVHAHEHGIVTSASLMARGDAAHAAAAYARAHPRLSVGLHIDLGEWVFRDGTWVSVYERVDRQDLHALETEIRAQLSICRELLGQDPSHLDSHQHVHIQEPVRSIVDRIGTELDVPVRHRWPRLRYDGRFYGQTGTGDPWPANISTARLMELLRDLRDGVTEMACHPGYPGELVTMYGAEREIELHALCDPDVRRVVRDERIALIAFSDLRDGTVEEIQRDVAWASVPEPVRAAAAAAPNPFEPVRVIESKQPEDGAVVYELFAAQPQGGAPAGGPAMEVRWHNEKAEVVP